jgi:TRAP-type mannitol/chloroaromatic compound transport system substrate-binding protein
MRLVKGGTQLRPFPRPVMEACEAAAFQLYDELSEKSPHWKRIYPGWKKFRDDHLIRGLRNMATDFALSGNDDYYECVTLAIEQLGGKVKPD